MEKKTPPSSKRVFLSYSGADFDDYLIACEIRWPGEDEGR